MKIKWFVILISLLMLFVVGCEDTDDDNDLTSLHTGDMISSSQLLSFESGEFVSTWDLAFVYENSSYWVKLNSDAHVLAVKSDTSFDAAELPIFGYSTDDGDSYIIGKSWQDSLSYDFADNHSIKSNGNAYFVLTSDLQWIKLEVLYGSQLMMKFRYMIDGGTGAIDTVTINYSADTPVYYYFTSTSEVTPYDWDLGFTSIPVYAGPSMGNIMMPQVMFNESKNIELAIINDQDFDDVTSVPGSNTWYTDSAILGYEGDQEVLNYHHDITKVLIDNADTHTYVFKVGLNQYKVRFIDYASGVVVFDFAEI